MKQITKFKRLLSGVMSAVMTISAVPIVSANAEESTEPYPYTMFAASSDEGAITVNAGNFCVNGNVAANGTIVSSGNMNINGTKTENAEESMIFIFDKIENQYFTASNVDEHNEDYTFDELNININVPTEIQGEATLTGNININNALKALEDVNLYGEVKNTNDSIIFSKYGDIAIDSQNVNLNGLVYAPFGTVTIDCDNLNLNGLIIAQNVVVNGNGANINYNNSWAEFVGTETEGFSWSYDDWQYLADTDQDGLPNLIEKEIGTEPYNPDTDGDQLPDGYEVLTLDTDPLKPDTDDNGISDYDEDFDTDGLTNGQEYETGTEPYNDDTDGDTLSDGDEVNTYFTDPLEVDTDKDGLDDDDEIYFNTDPNNPDSDGNGIFDGNEKRFQTFVHNVEDEDCAITEIRVSMEGTGNLKKTTTVESVMNKDVLCTGVVGLVGEPFSIETTSEFDSATLTFVVDKTKLGNTEFDNLLFLWYNEAENEFVELDTILDEENSMVSIETTHFSKYMIVDRKAWFDNWREIYERFEKLCYTNPSITAICVDCSGSMSSNDPRFIGEDGEYTCYRNLAVANFADAMLESDKTSLITFQSSAKEICGLTKDSSTIKSNAKFNNGGGTNANAAIVIALDELKTESGNRSIILLSDGDVNVSNDNIKYASENGIVIHTIGLGSGANNSLLKQYADKTGGEHFIAKTADDLEGIYDNLSETNQLNFDYMADTDGDGVPDDIEISGIPMPNGKLVYTDSNEKHSDKDDEHPEGDGLTDGEEVGKLVRQTPLSWTPEEYVKYKFTFKIVSDPTKIDSDYDGFDDDFDPNPFTSDIKLIELDRAKYINIKYYDQAKWTDTAFDKGNESYGSSQDWFDNYLMLDDNFYSDNPNENDNYIHMLKQYGCGLIAISDLAAYIAFNDTNIDLQDLNLYDADKDCFKYGEYMDYLFIMQKSFFVYWSLGNFTPQFPSKYLKYLNNQMTDNFEGYTCMSADNSYQKIKNSITSNIPVIMSYNTYFSTNDLALPLYVSNNDKLTSFKKDNQVKSHYMTITGIVEITDEIADKCSDIPSGKMLQVSSWGRKYYVNFEEYSDCIDAFTNLLIIRKV